MLNKEILLLLFLVIPAWFGSASSALGQNASMQGIITSDDTGESLYGANVALRSLSDEDVLGTAADSDGFYRIGSIEPDTYAIKVTYIGYQTFEDTLAFEAGENYTVNVALQPGDTQLDEVVIEQSTGAVMRDEGSQRISPVDLGRVPSPALGDLSTYIQTLPGVVAIGDRGGQVFIRGGTPSQNLVLLDGAMIYRPSHIVGFFSPFPKNIISGVDFYAGGFGPRYNSRVSSVMDIQLRHGNRRNFSGSASISPFAGELFFEGPIQKGESSWMLSARNSLIERTSAGVYPIEEQPLKFGSQLLKVSFPGQSDRCSAMIMHTYDRGRMDFEVNESIKWRNFALGGNCVVLPEDSQTLMQTNVHISSFSNSLMDAEGFGFSSNIWRVNMDINLRQYSGETRFEYGFFGRLKRLGFNMDEEFLGLNSDSFSQYILGGHFSTKIPIGDRFWVQPGTALTMYTNDYPLSIEPRFRFTWQPLGSDNQEMSGAAGIYRQPVTGVSDMRDASSVFVAWMSSPTGGNQMEAIHGMLSWQQSIGQGFSWSVEGYYKRIKNQPVPVWSTIAQFTTSLSMANGDTYGGDLRVEYDRGRFYGMLGYGYSWTLYEAAQDHFSLWFGEPVQEYHPPHDRRHQVNALISVDIGSYTAGLRWQLGSGMPFTKPMGFDDVMDFRERLPDVVRDEGIRRVILDKPYQGRLPTTHRLDVSLERSFPITSRARLNTRIGAVNAYDQTNIFYYDVFTHRRINQLPIVPYLTLKMEIGQ